METGGREEGKKNMNIKKDKEKRCSEGGDVLTFEKLLDRAIGEKAEVTSLVLKWSPDETATREGVDTELCIALSKPDLVDPCRLYKRFGAYSRWLPWATIGASSLAYWNEWNNGESSGGNDSATTTESHGWREQSLGEQVRLLKKQVNSGRHPGSGGHRHSSKKRS